jgi:hypothetical protein
LLELDNEDFRRFEFILRLAEFAVKKRKLNSGIIVKNNKQERDCNYSENFPAA